MLNNALTYLHLRQQHHRKMCLQVPRDTYTLCTQCGSQGSHHQNRSGNVQHRNPQLQTMGRDIVTLSANSKRNFPFLSIYHACYGYCVSCEDAHFCPYAIQILDKKFQVGRLGVNNKNCECTDVQCMSPLSCGWGHISLHQEYLNKSVSQAKYSWP